MININRIFYYISYSLYLFYIMGILIIPFYSDVNFYLLFLLLGVFFIVNNIIAIKYTKSVIVKIISIVSFIGYYFQLPYIHFSRERFEYGTFESIGYFDFSIYSYISVYIYVFIFLISISISYFVLSILLKINWKEHYITHINLEVITLNNKYIIHLAYFFIFMQILINIFMFHYKIGIPGLVPELMPLKIAGILYYYRMFVFPIVVFFIFVVQNKKISYYLVFLLLIEVLQAGILSGSKAIVLIHIMPIFYFFYLRKNYTLLILFLIFIFYYMSFVVLARNVTYEIFDLRELTISELFIRMITENNIGFFYRFFDGIYVFIFRMIGLREFLMIYNSPSPILSSTIFFFNNFFNFPFEHYANFNLSSMYGIDFEDQVLIEGYAFGYVFDKVGQLYISSSNYIMFMLLSVISGFIFILTELSILFLLRKSKIVNNLRIFLIFAISFFVVLNGGLYFKVIWIILFLYLLLSIFRIITNNHE